MRSVFQHGKIDRQISFYYAKSSPNINDEAMEKDFGQTAVRIPK